MNILLQAMACAAVAAPLDTGTLLTYNGQIEAKDDEAVRKTIEYQVLAAGQGEKGTRWLWLVSEKGQGGWPWIEQFGEMEVDDRGRVVAGKPASVLFEHAEGISPVPLLPPVFAGPEKLGDELTWREGRLSYEVRRPNDGDGAKAEWTIVVASPIGHKRTLHVPLDRPLVEDVSEVVFIGSGKEHRLYFSRVNEKKLEGAALEQSLEVFDSLKALRKSLDIQPQGGKVQWSEEQIARLKRELPAIVEAAAETPLADLTLRAAGDAKLQKAIAAAVEKLRADRVGKSAPNLTLPPATLSGKALISTDLKGKPLVLHLWDYRDNPLVEPYGQTGYLDFLHRKHKDDGVQVFGIAVDERLDRPDTRSEAVRSVRKLQSFMNLGYPIVLGGQQTLSRFGDPTQFGAELPLTVVIDADGKIAHYHTGLYEVDRDRGLAELDEVVEGLK